MKNVVEIYELSSEALEKSNFAKWKRSFGKASDGVLFFPAALFGDEQTQLFEIGYDGARCFTYRGHLFINQDWLLKNKKGKALDLVKTLLRIAR